MLISIDSLARSLVGEEAMFGRLQLILGGQSMWLKCWMRIVGRGSSREKKA